MISTDLWEDEHFAKLSDKAKLLFIACISNADDEGRLSGNIHNLRAHAFRFEDNKIEYIQSLLNELCEKMSNFEVYEVNGCQYIQFLKWNKYQVLRVDRMTKSSLPPPGNFKNELKLLPNNPNLPRDIILEVYKRDGARCRYCGKNKRPVHIDHIIPRIKGGKNTLENLVVACEKCNTKKREKTLEDLGWKLLPTIDGQLTGNIPPNLTKPNLTKPNLTKPTTMSICGLTYEKVLELWNLKMPWKIKEISETRKTHLRKRFKVKSFCENFPVILDLILKSDFLSGRKPSKTHPNFKADFDWIIANDVNYLKILENKYNNTKAEIIKKEYVVPTKKPEYKPIPKESKEKIKNLTKGIGKDVK